MAYWTLMLKLTVGGCCVDAGRHTCGNMVTCLLGIEQSAFACKLKMSKAICLSLSLLCPAQQHEERVKMFSVSHHGKLVVYSGRCSCHQSKSKRASKQMDVMCFMYNNLALLGVWGKVWLCSLLWYIYLLTLQCHKNFELVSTWNL